ncbi:hypothetical protein [Arthrobacter sp. efr-133-TYG-104]|uniref:hypothetical protein n=1 Tax=Arthrobacter sp. efr-133-TYG-104 TaxID=3040324 RepID=UPI00254DF2C6|nr:hypothetical protein [Arthrobacter sp. efr-133-TYG-104]
MTVALREPGPTPVAEDPLPTVNSDARENFGPVHCGSRMRITAGALRSTALVPLESIETMAAVEADAAVWPEWACACGFRMDVDVSHPMSGLWMAAFRCERLQYELALANDMFELAYNRALAAGVEPFAPSQTAAVPVGKIESLVPNAG